VTEGYPSVKYLLNDTPHSLSSGRRPSMNPMSRVTVKSEAKTHSRLKLYNYGEHPDIANEGDLLIVSDATDIQFQITVMGRDVSMLEEQVHRACELYEANKEYLSQPASRVVAAPAIARRFDRPDVQQRQDDLTLIAQNWASALKDSA
jgi:hypothetical protein